MRNNRRLLKDAGTARERRRTARKKSTQEEEKSQNKNLELWVTELWLRCGPSFVSSGRAIYKLDTRCALLPCDFHPRTTLAYRVSACPKRDQHQIITERIGRLSESHLLHFCAHQRVFRPTLVHHPHHHRV